VAKLAKKHELSVPNVRLAPLGQRGSPLTLDDLLAGVFSDLNSLFDLVSVVADPPDNWFCPNGVRMQTCDAYRAAQIRAHRPRLWMWERARWETGTGLTSAYAPEGGHLSTVGSRRLGEGEKYLKVHLER